MSLIRLSVNLPPLRISLVCIALISFSLSFFWLFSSSSSSSSSSEFLFCLRVRERDARLVVQPSESCLGSGRFMFPYSCFAWPRKEIRTDWSLFLSFLNVTDGLTSASEKDVIRVFKVYIWNHLHCFSHLQEISSGLCTIYKTRGSSMFC